MKERDDENEDDFIDGDNKEITEDNDSDSDDDDDER